MERQKVKKKEPSGAIFISLLRESHMSLTKIVTRLSQSNQVMQLFLSILTTASTLNSVSYYLNFFFFYSTFFKWEKGKTPKLIINFSLFLLEMEVFSFFRRQVSPTRVRDDKQTKAFGKENVNTPSTTRSLITSLSWVRTPTFGNNNRVEDCVTSID